MPEQLQAVLSEDDAAVAVDEGVGHHVDVGEVVGQVHEHAHGLRHGLLGREERLLHHQADEVREVADDEDDGDGGEDAEHAGGDVRGVRLRAAAPHAGQAPLEAGHGAGDAPVEDEQGDEDGDEGGAQQGLQGVVQRRAFALLARAADVHADHLRALGKGGVGGVARPAPNSRYAPAAAAPPVPVRLVAVVYGGEVFRRGQNLRARSGCVDELAGTRRASASGSAAAVGGGGGEVPVAVGVVVPLPDGHQHHLHPVDEEGDEAQGGGPGHDERAEGAGLARAEPGLQRPADLGVAREGDEQQDAAAGQAGAVHLQVRQLAGGAEGRRLAQRRRLDDHVDGHAHQRRGEVQGGQHDDEGGEDGARHLEVVDVEDQGVAHQPHRHQDGHHHAVGQARVVVGVHQDIVVVVLVVVAVGGRSDRAGEPCRGH